MGEVPEPVVIEVGSVKQLKKKLSETVPELSASFTHWKLVYTFDDVFNDFGDSEEEEDSLIEMAQRIKAPYVGSDQSLISVSPDHASALRSPGSLLRLEMKRLRNLMEDPDFQQVWSLVRGLAFRVEQELVGDPFSWFGIIFPALPVLTSLNQVEGTGPVGVEALVALLESRLLLSWTNFSLLDRDIDDNVNLLRVDTHGRVENWHGFEFDLASLEGLVWSLTPDDFGFQNLTVQCTEAWDSSTIKCVVEMLGKVNFVWRLKVRYGMLSEEKEECLAEALQGSKSTVLRMLLFRFWDIEEWSSISTLIIGSHNWRYLGIHLAVDDDIGKSTFVYAAGRPECKLEKLSVVHGFPEMFPILEKAVSTSKIKFLRTETIQSWDHILHSNVEVLQLDNTLSSESGKGLCKAVANPSFKLCKLKMFCQLQSTLERKLLAALESNYHSLLVELDIPWTTPAFKVKATQLLHRNPYFDQKILVRPTTAKLFMCGHGRVGKTTIAKNLTRTWSTNYYPALLQRHASTSGINLRPLEFDNEQTLLVCDLAGQQEFHAFHHYFVRGSEKNLFLLVCKVVRGNVQELRDQLTYWLRFIVSHRSLAAGPTKVLVALNRFSKKKDMDYDPMDTATNICNMYDQGTLGVESQIFGVVATKVKEVKQLTSKLHACLVDLLGTQHEIPRACMTAKLACQSLVQQGTCKILHINDVAKDLLGSPDADLDIVKAVLGVLHENGDVIYFGSEHGIISQYTVIHVQWFLRDVISHFLRPAATRRVIGKEGYAEKEKITYKLKSECKETSSNEHPQYIFEALHEMGVLLPMQDGEREMVVMPALLTQEYSSTFPSGNKCWGRRFSCKDRKFNLLPAAIFAKLEVKLQVLCNNPSFDLGNGWASFEDDCIRIVVRVGGDTDSWEDRQWVDVMISGPSERRGMEKEAEDWLKNVRDCIIQICMEACPSLELEENVLRQSYVRQRLTGGEGQQQDPDMKEWEKLVCSVDRIKVQAREKGLYYLHTWESGCQDELADLLFPLEQQHQLQVKAEEINELSRIYQDTISKTYTGAPRLSIKPQKSHSFSDHPELGWLARRLECHMDDGFGQMDKRLDRIEETLDEVKEKMNMLILDGKKILVNCSRLLQNIEVECPRFPHLRDESNSFQRYCKVVGKTVRVHYLCESHSGSHFVQGSKGVPLVVAPEWFQASARALKPALILLFMGAKVGGSLAGAGEITNIVVDGVKDKLSDFLNSCIQDGHLVEAPSAEDVERIFERVVTEVGGGDKKRIMQQYFALQPRSFENRTAWVCQDHL